jgi:hypothetical protein
MMGRELLSAWYKIQGYQIAGRIKASSDQDVRAVAGKRSQPGGKACDSKMGLRPVKPRF